MISIDSLQSATKRFLPASTRARIRQTHRRLVFQRAMRHFLCEPTACIQPGSTVLADLVYGWGNYGWSACDEYLRACIEQALAGRGAILECGSGLSTVLIGAIAKNNGQRHWALEHTEKWAARVQKHLDKYNLDNVQLCVNSLKKYGEFTWYDAPTESMPKKFSLIICDGPPSDTEGGRYGLVPVMHNWFEGGCIVLLDDACREEEVEIARRWASELGSIFDIRGSSKPYIEMRIQPS